MTQIRQRDQDQSPEADQPISESGRHSFHRAAAITGFLLLIELCLRFTPAGSEHWHYAFHRLYYLAIIGGGLSFGWRGGLLTALVSSFFYLLHTQDTDSPDARNELDRYLETIVFGLVGLLAGVLSDRERHQRETVERARLELQVLNRELNENVEHVKRAARMSALGHLSAGLAHEIRNPLASIKGAAELVQAGTSPQSRDFEFVAIIDKECRRLDRLVTDFLDFARPRAPALDEVDMGQLLETVVQVIERTAACRDVTYRREIEPELPKLQCDSEQLKQVLLNLVLNAVQAMLDGGQVEVSAKQVRDGIYVSVSDTGPGIPADAVDSIFDPFFTTKPNGTGLGLPVAYQIIQQHGGELSLVRNGQKGATFGFTLPLRGTSAAA